MAGDPQQRLPPFGAAGPFHLALDARQQQPEHIRDTHQQPDGVPLERRDDRGGAPTGGVIDRRPSGERRQHAGRLFEHVGQREQRQQVLADRDRHRVERRLDVRRDIRVGEHHALGQTGGTGREHQLRRVALPPAWVSDPSRTRRRLGKRGHAERWQRADAGRLANQQARLGALAEPVDHLEWGLRIDRDQDGAGQPDAKHARHQLGRIRRQHHHPVAGADAGGFQPGGRSRGRLCQTAVGPDLRTQAAPDRERGSRTVALGGAEQQLGQCTHQPNTRST